MNYKYWEGSFNIPSEVKIVSFDVFDTLLSRSFERPSDLFLYMNNEVSKIIGKEIDFYNLRKEAEKDCRKKMPYASEITLNEIYQNFTQIEDRFKNRIKNLELQQEVKFCFPRKSGKGLYDTAKKKGLKLIATSDIYIEKDELEKLLNEKGYFFDEIFSSSSIKKTKRHGDMFNEIAQKLSVKPNEILHIGDNYSDDILKAKQMGLHTFFLPKIKDVLYSKNKCYKKLFNRVAEKSLLSSIAAAVIFKQMEESGNFVEDSLFGNSLYNFGFNAIGLMMFAYANWLYKELNEQSIKKVYFVARDGYIMKRVFDLLYGEKEIKTYYFETSRSATFCLNINSKEDLNLLLNFKKTKNLTLRNYIENKLNCDANQISAHLPTIGFQSLDDKIKRCSNEKLKKIVDFYRDEIFIKMQTAKENFLKYVEKSDILNGKIAICDIGYTGSFQHIINKLKGSDEDVFGFYFITHRKIALQNAKGFLVNKGSKFFYNSYMRHANKIFESAIFSAPHLSIIKYNNGEAIYENLNPIELQRISKQTEIWNGIIDFNIAVKQIFGNDIQKISYDKSKIADMFFQFLMTPTMQDATLFKNISFENKFTNGSVKYIVEDNLWQFGKLAVYSPKLFKSLMPLLKLWLSFRERLHS